MNNPANKYNWTNCTQNVRFHHSVFNGKEKDYESGFHYYGARYYWSELLTSWLSVDPMIDSLAYITPYSYCINNPIKLKDNDGNIPIIPIIIGAIEIGTTIYDAIGAGKTLLDNNATPTAKWAAVGGLALDIALPGGGYGAAYRMTSKTIFKIAGKEYRTASEFYKASKKLSIGERMTAYKEMADEVASKEKWVFDKTLSKKNGGRRIYTDKSTGMHYSLDTEKGHFEVLDKKGHHQGSIDFEGKAMDRKDKSGKHNIKI